MMMSKNRAVPLASVTSSGIEPATISYDFYLSTRCSECFCFGFAAAVKREDITDGAELLGLEVNEHIANVIEAMQG